MKLMNEKAVPLAKSILHLNDISFAYDNTELVLKNISIKFEAGNIYALVGCNGGGKSTLAKIISGELAPQSGSIYFNNAIVTFSSPRQAITAGVIRISQEYDLIENLTIAENISLSNEHTSTFFFKKDKENFYAKAILSRMGVELDVQQKVKDFPISYFPIISIAKALARNPKVLIIDETTSLLSTKDVEEFFRLLHVLRSEGICIIIITHNLEEIFRISDNIVVLKEGKISLQTDAHIDRDELIEEMFDHVNINLTKASIKVKEEKKMSYRVESLTTTHLNNVSVSFYDSEVVGLLCKNKASLNDLTDCISGFVQPIKGKFFKNNVELIINNPSEAIRAGIAYVRGDQRKISLFYNLGVFENIAFFMMKQLSTLGFLPFEKLKKYVSDRIGEYSITTLNEFQQIDQLSGGNQQKILLSKWISINPNLLILKEPTAGIDYRSKFLFYENLLSLKRIGTAFILFGSDWDEMKNLCDRFVFIENGVIVKDLTKSQLDNSTTYAEFF